MLTIVSAAGLCTQLSIPLAYFKIYMVGSVIVFLLTEAFPELRDVYVDEIMEDMDRNKDGYVTVEEYVGECDNCLSPRVYMHVYFCVVGRRPGFFLGKPRCYVPRINRVWVKVFF